MKKIVLTIVAVVLFGGVAFSQVNLGGRFSGGNVFGGELSVQFGMGESNRIEADLGIYPNGPHHYNDMTVTGAYHWTFNIVKGFGWFIGPGAQLRFRHFNDNTAAELGLGICAQGGVEYNFDFPLQLSLDVRPMVDVLHIDTDPFFFFAAVGVRYRF